MAGEDFRSGDVLFDAGEQVGVAHLGVLASAGVQAVGVYRRPRVAIISSGDELVELADFTTVNTGERIVSSNSVTLAAMVRDAGASRSTWGSPVIQLPRYVRSSSRRGIAI